MLLAVWLATLCKETLTFQIHLTRLHVHNETKFTAQPSVHLSTDRVSNIN